MKMTDPVAHIEDWLVNHTDRFAHPFHALAGMLLESWDEVRSRQPMAADEYRAYCAGRTIGSGMPFQVSPLEVEEGELSAEQFVNAYDTVHYFRMVRGHMLGLLRHLLDSRGCVSLLDYGAGPACGLYTAENACAFKTCGIATARVAFWAIDKCVTPSGSVFPNACYRNEDLLTFDHAERFDLITAHHVLEHCREWRDVFGKAYDLLKPGGCLFLSFPTFGGFYDTTYRLLTRDDHVATFTNGQILRHVESLGYEIVYGAPYVDPFCRFNWLPRLEPLLIDDALQSSYYDLCVMVGLRSGIFFHHYGIYLVLRKK